jgi:hypothetical protein
MIRQFVVCVCGALALSGCGGARDNLPRQTVSGTVTLDDKPLEQGTITFTPAAEGATPSMVSISGGKYYIGRAEGLVPGNYKVKISSTPITPPVIDPVTGTPPPPGAHPPTPKELLQPKYNSTTALTAEVKEGASNTFDFPLETERKR